MAIEMQLKLPDIKDSELSKAAEDYVQEHALLKEEAQKAKARMQEIVDRIIAGMKREKVPSFALMIDGQRHKWALEPGKEKLIHKVLPNNGRNT